MLSSKNGIHPSRNQEAPYFEPLLSLEPRVIVFLGSRGEY